MLQVFPIDAKFEKREKKPKYILRYLYTNEINVFLQNSMIFSLYRIADAFSKADNCLMFPSKKCNEKPAQNPSEKAEEKSGEESVEKPGAKKEDTKKENEKI